MRTLVTLTLLGIGMASIALAGAVPEIDPGSGMNVLALVAGAALVFRGRRKK